MLGRDWKNGNREFLLLNNTIILGEDILNKLTDLEKKIGFEFDDEDLLNQAFVHSSYLNEHNELNQCNERLEFLGDAVLELVVTEHMYENLIGQEGELHKERVKFVKNDYLSEIANNLRLDNFLMKGNGESNNEDGINTRTSNVLEALIGAIFLDGKETGYQKAKEFVLKHVILNPNV
ncbi:ribonuclease III family protein [Methanohalophilus sp. RSK]|uniref:ribonuclease III family protein n=1 Tax=Methanohalophilus sp. RSK TaxID=2485783 RepID=UPI001F2C4CBF|nr:ribonuclease III domain-containing protein [Methanohalophilus sp. RSK]